MFYLKLNEEREQFKSKTRACNDENGTLLIENTKVLARTSKWRPHFDDLHAQGTYRTEDYVLQRSAER